jgi:hypothetical protein
VLTTPGGAGAALAALPFIAQAAASAITFGLGAALTGVGIYAEAGTRKVAYQFSQLVSGPQGINATLKNISPAFGQALATILNAARTFVPQFIRGFGPALDAIAGPLKDFGVMIAGTLAKPEVADSLRAVGVAFGAILKALTPAIPGIVTAIADGITNIARAVARNPKMFADFVIGLSHLAGMALDAIGWLTQVANFIEQKFVPALLGLGSAIAMPFRVATALSISAPKEFTKFGNIVIGVGQKIVLAFDIVKESVRIAFDQLEIAGLKAALGITTAFGHLPGPLGAPFRTASAAIRGDLAKVQGDVANAVNNISADWAKLNGKTANLYVYTNFVNIGSPPATGGIFPTPSGRPPGTHAAGTSFALPGLAWVGERGPELIGFRGGETVIPSHAARGYAAAADTGRLEALLAENNDLLASLIGVTAAAPARTGAGLGAALSGAARKAGYRALYS